MALKDQDNFLINDGVSTEKISWPQIKEDIVGDPVVTASIEPTTPVIDTQARAEHREYGGKPPYSFTYQWFTCTDSSGGGRSDLGGQTTQYYTPVSADFGKFLGCDVTITDQDAKTNTSTAISANAVTAPPLSVNLTIDGTPKYTETADVIQSTYNSKDVYGVMTGFGAKYYMGNMFVKLEHVETEYGTTTFQSTTGDLNNISADINQEATRIAIAYNF